MVTSAVIMGIMVLLSGYLMISEQPRSGLLSDACPVIIGNVAGEIWERNFDYLYALLMNFILQIFS